MREVPVDHKINLIQRFIFFSESVRPDDSLDTRRIFQFEVNAKFQILVLWRVWNTTFPHRMRQEQKCRIKPGSTTTESASPMMPLIIASLSFFH